VGSFKNAGNAAGGRPRGCIGDQTGTLLARAAAGTGRSKRSTLVGAGKPAVTVTRGVQGRPRTLADTPRPRPRALQLPTGPRPPSLTGWSPVTKVAS
jgi:hypothetical protein